MKHSSEARPAGSALRSRVQRLPLVALPLLAVAATLLWQPPAAPETAAGVLAQARQFEEKRQPLEAARKYERAGELDPAQARACGSRAGWNYLDARRLAEARRVFARVLEEAPRDAGAADGLGLVLFEAGDSKALLELVKQRTPPEDQPEVLEVLRAGGEAASGSPERGWALGLLHTQWGGADPRAIPHLRQVTAALPDLAAARWRLGELYQRTGQPVEAEGVFEEYVRRHPDTPEAYALRARRKAADSPLAALEEIEAGLDRFPESPVLYRRAVGACRLISEPPAAVGALRALVSRAQREGNRVGVAIARMGLLRYCTEQRRYAEAEPVARDLARDMGAMGSPHWLEAGQLALAQGQPAAAVDDFARAAGTRTPAEPARTARLWQAVALLASGSKEAARALVLPLLELDSPHAAAWLPELPALGYWLRTNRLGDFPVYRPGEERELGISWSYRAASAGPARTTGLPEDAMARALREIVTRHPDCYPAHHAIARRAAGAQDREAARLSLEAARAVKPSWWAIRWALANYYLATDSPALARPELEAVRKLAPSLPLLPSALARLGP